MTNPKLTKVKITEAVVKELPESSKADIGEDIDKILTRWWATGRQDGLRLTDYGDLNFRMAEIEFYNFSLENDIKNNHKMILVTLTMYYLVGGRQVDKMD